MSDAIDTARFLAGVLRDEGVAATIDPRAVEPPCVLIEPPTLTFEVGCGATGTWALVALAPAPADLDAWERLDQMATTVADVLPIERAEFGAYQLTGDAPTLPCYRMTLTKAVDL